MNVAGSHELPFTTVEGGIVNGKENTHRRLIYSDGLECLGSRGVCDCITDVEAFDPDESTDIARGDTLYLGAT